MDLCDSGKFIDYFSIYGLHGDRNVRLSFDSGYKILIAKNGSGKTTALNALNGVLTADADQLSKINFEKIEIKFSSEKRPLEIKRSDIVVDQRIEMFSSIHFKKLVDFIGVILAEDIVNEVAGLKRLDEIRTKDVFLKAMRRYPGTDSSLFNHLMAIKRSGLIVSRNKEFLNIKKKIKSIVDLDTLYFPTYRRVEDSRVLQGYEDELKSTSGVIKFGMGDVKKLFDSLTDQVRSSYIADYSEMSGQMLGVLAGDVSLDFQKKMNLRGNRDLEILLDRLGDNISNENKFGILNIVNGEKFYDPQYGYLLSFLINLMDSYYKNKEKDDLIQSFCAAASKYFDDKYVSYNESTFEIKIISHKNSREVFLDMLSSGEKQIISILSKVYLGGERKFAIIFDEPEISLSIDWQRMILLDIVSSGRCGFLLAATHSPFIFDNALDVYADALDISYRD